MDIMIDNETTKGRPRNVEAFDYLNNAFIYFDPNDVSLTEVKKYLDRIDPLEAPTQFAHLENSLWEAFVLFRDFNEKNNIL